MEPRAMRDEVPDRAAVEAQLGEWATYGAQLRAWVGLQVDEHVSRVVPGLLDARLLPISEMLNDLRRHVANLQDRSRNWSLDTEMHRLEQRLSSSRFDAVGDLENRTRLSMEALAAEEAQARHQLELRLGQVEAITKVLDETLHAVDSENGRSLQDAFAQLAAKVEVLDETLHAVDSGSNQLSAQVQALDESFRGEGAPSRVEAELRSLSAKVEVLDETFQSQFPSVRTLADKVQVLDDSFREVAVTSATGGADARFDDMHAFVKAMDDTYKDVAMQQDALKQSQAFQQQALRQVEARVQSLEKPLDNARGGPDVRTDEWLTKRLQEQSSSSKMEMEKMRQSLLALVRCELAKAFRSEARAITAMDDQMRRKLQEPTT